MKSGFRWEQDVAALRTVVVGAGDSFHREKADLSVGIIICQLPTEWEYLAVQRRSDRAYLGN